MNISLVAAFIWVIAANVAAMLPSNDNLWRRAYALIAIGVPLLGWVTFENGPLIGLICLAAGVSLLRWPVRYLGRWMRSKTIGEPAE
ncbi:uncharacterized protein DUF2484 [Litoreibacter halocynthiae]|uniref:Uncharacterized protein DUF2484 n=1 Tax=Litoreibacter halocynthiae TaxID=1242689 RepID=A0A4R7LMH3_9RHOB|nr:DUF2484 family protein [Litoreibacter halocynthiae]TDT77213.1 uncharacterized protein DUF2484 [Litoreibacter halocynthiae]